MSVELCRAYQAHDGGSALTCSQRAGEQPVASADGPWTYLVFDPVVINGHEPIVEIARERLLSFEAVIQRFRNRRALRN